MNHTPPSNGRYTLRMIMRTCTIAPCFAGARVLSGGGGGKRRSEAYAYGKQSSRLSSTPKCAASDGDRIGVVDVRVGVLDADDDDAERRLVAPLRRQHRGGEPFAVVGAQGQKQRHRPRDVGFQPDVALHRRDAGRRTIVFPRALEFAQEIFVDSVAHHRRLALGLVFSLDPEPGLAAWRVTYELHLARLARAPRAEQM